MIIYPAIDLHGGKVVRLKEGDPSQQTVFSDDPVLTARQWLAAGAHWIHMVNLDGAFSAANNNGKILEQVAQLDLRVQFGGGLRSLSDIQQAFDHGASRVVLGTIAINDPAIVAKAVARWGSDNICVALDARDGKITTHGWQQVANVTPAELGKAMVEVGIQHALFTDVSRDGGLTGVNVEATIDLGHTTGLKVIASGGLSSIAEIQQLQTSRVVAGAVIGMALYEGKISLTDALNAVKGSSNAN